MSNITKKGKRPKDHRRNEMILFINFDFSMNFISFTLKSFTILIAEMD
jgi:hypothetical protein